MTRQLFFFLGCLLLWSMPAGGDLLGQSPLRSMVHFAVNEHRLDQEAESQLDQLLDRLEGPYRCYRVTIAGHTDADGDLAFNTALSQRRAGSVRQWLLEQGVPEAAIHVAGEGELRPVAGNDSEKGKARNRRVELRFVPDPGGCGKRFDFDVAFEEYEFDAGQAADFTYKPSGTRVRIPGNALMDENGKPVTGRVSYRYREWRDGVEFLVSDINMEYPRRNSGQHFQSGGMFELQAFQNGRELSMIPGRNAALNFVLTDSGTGYDLYAYDPRNEQWHEPGVSPSTGRLASNQLPATCEESINLGQPDDTVQTFLSLLDTALYYLAQPRYNRQIEFTRLPNFNRCWADRNYLGLNYVGDLSPEELQSFMGITLSAYRHRWSGKRRFLSIRDRLKTNPELEALSHTEMYITENAYNLIAKQLCTKTFGDVRVAWKGRNNAVITLKEPGRFHRIPVRIRDKRRHRPNPKISAMDDYLRRLRLREVAYTQSRMARLETVFWQYSKFLMPREERCMDREEWIDLFSRRPEAMKARYSMAKAAYADNREGAETLIRMYLDSLQYRLDNGLSITPRPPAIAGFYKDPEIGNFMADLSVSGFGVWNCDQIARLQDPVAVQASYYEDEQGNKLRMELVSVIDNRLNGVLNYYPHYKVPIGFNRNGQAVMVGVAKTGKRYYLDSAGMRALARYNGSVAVVRMREIPAGIDSPGELRSLLGLNSWM